MRRLARRRRLGRRIRRARPANTWVSVVAHATRASRRWAFRRTRSTASRGSSGRGWPRAREALGDTGESSPEHWEKPLGTRDVHVVLTALSPDAAQLEAALGARAQGVPGPVRASRRSGGRTATRSRTGKEPFGFRDGIGHPAIEGSGIPGTQLRASSPSRRASSSSATPTRPAACRRCRGPTSSVATAPTSSFRKLHQRVAAFRRYLKENASSPDEEELLAAKMMGRWRSGAPLALCPLHDDPGARCRSRSATTTSSTPTTRPGTRRRPGSHIRRANPRDASVAGRRPAPPDDPPRHRLRPRASRGRPRGRRRRSRA